MNGNMEDIIMNMLESFDIKLMISITVFTYCILKILDTFISKTSKSLKKVITVVLSALLCYIYYKYMNVTLEQIIPTYLISVAFYDNLIKFIINKLKIGYKK